MGKNGWRKEINPNATSEVVLLHERLFLGKKARSDLRPTSIFALIDLSTGFVLSLSAYTAQNGTLIVTSLKREACKEKKQGLGQLFDRPGPPLWWQR